MPEYGIPGVARRRPGCLLTVVIIVLAIVVSIPVGALITETVLWFWELLGARPPGSIGTVVFVAQSTVAVTAAWLGFRLHRRLTQRRVHWCPRCGVRTNPHFDVCRSCGRVKRAA